MRGCLLSGRPANEHERDVVLRYQRSAAAVSAVMWSCGALVFGVIGLAASPARAATIAGTILLGGLSTCAISYLLAERRLRPVTAAALAAGPPPRPSGPGVAARMTMTWALATAVPLLGVVAV